MIRSAQPKDLAAVEAIVAAAYGIYIDRIGKPPGPMLDDYRELIAAGAMSLIEEPDTAGTFSIIYLMRQTASGAAHAVRFSLDSHSPCPYQRCYCSICRKSAGGGGYAINIMGIAGSLRVDGRRAIRVWHAMIDGEEGSAARHFCRHCGSALWVSDEQWPELVHPFASAIDTRLPKPPATVHLLLRDKADWVEPQIGPHDELYEGYPPLSIEEWHKRHGVWIA